MTSSTLANEPTASPGGKCHPGGSHMPYFNYSKAAREACIPPDALADICKSVREEFPTDDMMYELHVLRACMAVRDGAAKLGDILPHEPAAVASP